MNYSTRQPDEFEVFRAAYIEALMWSETCRDENDKDPCGWDNFEWATEDDLEVEGLKQINNDCASFFDANWPWFAGKEAHAGYDFCLTRNRHGCGFWDGGWPDDDGDHLTKESKPYGTMGLMWQGEDEPIHVHG